MEHIKKDILISGNSVVVDFEILQKVREMLTELGIDVLKLINNTQWDVLLFEELLAENIDIKRIKKLRLVINGTSENKSGKTITVPIEKSANEKQICDVTDSGVVLSGFTVHYTVFDES
jgi:hypothetical protein